MGPTKTIALFGSFDEGWGAALKEKGFNYLLGATAEEVLAKPTDFMVVDARQAKFRDQLPRLKNQLQGPIVSLIEDSMSQADLKALSRSGCSGYLSSNTPPQEMVLRIHAMLKSGNGEVARAGEARTAKRVWFQQKVKFSIFNDAHEAWSTTISETGIFIRTALSFPIYSVLHLDFNLWGDSEPFRCDGVIVRQETESEIKGLGIMFQNLKGESVRRLEAFFGIYH